MLQTIVAIVLVTLISLAHAYEQDATIQTDTAPIENPSLPRPKPPLLDSTGDNPAMMISAFRHQHGEDSVVINAALTRVAQEQANAMPAQLTRSRCIGPIFKPDQPQRFKSRGRKYRIRLC